MGGDRRLVIGLALTAVIAGGCIGESSLEFGTPVNLRVWTTETTVEVDAPGWTADTSRVYVCAAEPPRPPEGAADREGWAPGGSCQDFGTYPSADGLRATLPLGAFDADQQPAFDAASDWYLLLLGLDGARVSSSIRTRFHAPPGGVP